jgi:hypothetical protein
MGYFHLTQERCVVEFGVESGGGVVCGCVCVVVVVCVCVRVCMCVCV